MASYKHLALVTTILAIFTAGVYATDLIVGNRESGDELACTDNSVHLAAQPGKVLSASRTCSGLKYRHLVNRVEARDTSGAGRGGFAIIQSGGIYQNSVTIYMWSQPGQPLDFSLNVYSKYY